jgi:hypothetical protein
VFNKGHFLIGDFGRGVNHRSQQPHQIRLELLAPPFLSRDKVEYELPSTMMHTGMFVSRLLQQRKQF